MTKNSRKTTVMTMRTQCHGKNNSTSFCRTCFGLGRDETKVMNAIIFLSVILVDQVDIHTHACVSHISKSMITIINCCWISYVCMWLHCWLMCVVHHSPHCPALSSVYPWSHTSHHPTLDWEHRSQLGTAQLGTVQFGPVQIVKQEHLSLPPTREQFPPFWHMFEAHGSIFIACLETACIWIIRVIKWP